ncbi:MAG: hypothetical protein MJ078_08785, partial [Clostridia bacterium]|nr:hypothetical protein [Clostridia bacterium]
MIETRKVGVLPIPSEVMMEKPFLSLLFPNEEALTRHERGERRPAITEETAKELGLSQMIGLKNSCLSDYFTTDPEVIAYRQKTLNDLMKFPALGETLAEALPVLSDVEELRRLDAEGSASGESYLYSITEIELYISCTKALQAGLAPL